MKKLWHSVLKAQAILCLFISISLAQSTLSPAHMQEELQMIKDFIKRIHPDPFFNLSEQQFESLIRDIESKIAVPMSDEEFYFLLNRLPASLGDAHTALHMRSERRYLPLTLLWTSDGLVIAQANTNKGPQVGDRILAIADVSSESLLDRFKEVISHENPYWVKAKAAESLSLGSYLAHFNLVVDNTVELTIENSRGETRDMVVSLGDDLPPHLASSPRPWYGWQTVTSNSLGYFYLDRCQFTDAYIKALEAFFSEVAQKGIKNIIFDVRKNSGGSSRVVNELLRYLPIWSGGWLTNFISTRVKWYLSDIRFSPEAAQDRDYSETSGYSYADLTLREVGANYMPAARPPDPESIFYGTVYLLTSNHTFSSANWFAVVLQDNRLAVVVGEPTGNAPSSFGDVLQFELPHSHFYFQISHKRFYRPDLTKDELRTIFPDITVMTGQEDIRLDRDAQMQAVISIIKGERAAGKERPLR